MPEIPARSLTLPRSGLFYSWIPMPLTPADIDAIADQTAVKLAARNRADWVDPQTHTKHHRWLENQMKREADFVELRQKIMTSACIWAIPIILAFTLTAIGRELIRLVKVGVGP